MMVLLFKLDNARFALDVGKVVEIMPKVALKPLPRVPEYIPGLINYRGKVVPVLDLVMMVSQRPAANSLSTRIVLVNLENEGEKNRLVGLIVEEATETTKINLDDVLNTGISPQVDAFVDAVVLDKDEMIGIVNLNRLIPHELNTMVGEKSDSTTHVAGEDHVS